MKTRASCTPIPNVVITNKLFFAILATFLCTGFASFDYYIELHRNVLEIEMAVESDFDTGITQLFFDIGDSYNPQDSLSVTITSDHKFHVLSYKFPRMTVRSLRFDPLNTPGQLVIKNIKLINHEITQIFNQPKVIPLNDIDSIASTSNGLEISTKGNDSSLILDLPRTYLSKKLTYIDIKNIIFFAFRLFFILFPILFAILIVVPLQSCPRPNNHQ